VTGHWVVGAGGLLGSGVERFLRSRDERVFAAPSIDWAGQAGSQLATSLGDFVADFGDEPWIVYWCAGAATPASPAAAFEREQETLARFVEAIESLPEPTLARGTLFFASSAGGVYGGSTDAPFSEDSVVAPIGRYGAAKLAAERLVSGLTRSSGLGVAIGRIANLYGPGQSLTKQQGLVTRLCLATMTRVPLSIFVSADTLRDYLYVDDCASLVVRLSLRVSELRASKLGLSEPGGGAVTKILASGQSIGIAGLITQLGLITHRRPAIVWGQSAEAGLQGRDLRMRSVILPELDREPRTNLADGIARTLEATRVAYQASR
jgi:UDP-glucose 4-epimerase